MAIELPDETKRRMCTALQHFCRERLDQDVGLLQAELLYDFALRHIGATIYNQAIDDAHAWMVRKLLDLEGELHEQVEPVS